ncbi:hypothetical protein BDAP_001812 [Binucleata daphniae]
MNKKNNAEKCDTKMNTDVSESNDETSCKRVQQKDDCAERCLNKIRCKINKSICEKRLENKVRHLLMQENIFQDIVNNTKNTLTSGVKVYKYEQKNDQRNKKKCDVMKEKTPQITIIIDNDVFMVNKEGLHLLHIASDNNNSTRFAKLLYDLYSEFYINKEL